MIQQESLPLLHPHPFPHPLFPHRHIRQMIQRIQLQELSPKRLFPLPQPQLLLHPHLSSPHPQFVAAKSLIVNPPDFVYTSYYAVKALCVTYNYLRRETIFFPHIFYSYIYENSVEKDIKMSYNSNVNIAYKSKKQEKERIEYA